MPRYPEMGPIERTLAEGMVSPEGREKAKDIRKKEEVKRDWEKFGETKLWRIMEHFGAGEVMM